jgi:hypothetical protein
MSPTCRGIEETTLTHLESIPLALRLSNSCGSSTPTSRNASSMSASPPAHQTTSLPHNGNTSSKESPSTSTKSSLLSTGLQLLKSGRRALEKQISLLDQLKQQERCRHHRIGLPHGTEQQEGSRSSSLTGNKSSRITPNISRTNSQLKTQLDTNASSSMISPSEISFEEGNKSVSPNSTGSPRYTQPLFYRMESSTPEGKDSRHERRRKSATGSTTKDATHRVAGIVTYAKRAPAQLTESLPATQSPGIEQHGMRPKYLRYNIWDPAGNLAKASAEWTEEATPLPRPSSEQLMHPIVRETVAAHPHLFEVNTPIKIEIFESLLADHPNPTFVKSVCDGLRYGFWP